jgi:hypothetical protein
MRAAFLLFDTDFTAQLVRKNIKNGKVVLKDGEHIVDKTKPLILQSGLGTRPLYLVKWNSIYPMTFELQEKTTVLRDEAGKEFKLISKELIPVKTEFYEKGGAGYSPEILKTTQDVRFLKGLGKYSEGGRDMRTTMTWVLGIVIFIAAAFLIGQLLLGGGFGGFHI